MSESDAAPDQKIPTLAPIGWLSRAINEALASDTANKTYLQTLGDIRFLIKTTRPEITILVEICAGSVETYKVSDADSVDADIAITGDAVQLLKMLIQPRTDAAELRAMGIRIDGDVGLMMQLAQLSEKIDIDWQAIIADRLGEPAAMMLDKGAQQARQISTALSSRQKDFIEGILCNDNEFVPTRAQFDQFKSTLRDINDRLDALETKRAQTTSESAR